MTRESQTLPRFALATVAALAAALAMTTATAGAAPNARSAIHVKLTAANAGSVTVLTTGRRLKTVMACDLKAHVCVQARRTARHRWAAVLPLASRDNPVGVIAKSGGDYLFASAR
jgi:hypothetical protein